MATFAVAIAFSRYGAVLAKILYIDEAGDPGPMPSPPEHDSQPVLVIGGIIIDSDCLYSLTHDFMNLKKRFYPKQPRISQHFDWLLLEIKGSLMRNRVIRGNARVRAHTLGFLDNVLALLKRYEARIVARVSIKKVGGVFDAKSVYTSSIQAVCYNFEAFLEQIDDYGFCIADGRSESKNINLAHSVSTKKFRRSHNEYNRLCEVPAFGYSNNHVGIQLSDLICSGLIFPIACHVYCTGFVANHHVNSKAVILKQRYSADLRNMQFRYFDQVEQRTRGGIVVSDGIQGRPSTRLLR